MQRVIDELIYQNYRYNRQRSPEIEPYRWAKIYENVPQMEQRFHQETMICVN